MLKCKVTLIVLCCFVGNNSLMRIFFGQIFIETRDSDSNIEDGS